MLWCRQVHLCRRAKCRHTQHAHAHAHTHTQRIPQKAVTHRVTAAERVCRASSDSISAARNSAEPLALKACRGIGGVVLIFVCTYITYINGEREREREREREKERERERERERGREGGREREIEGGGGKRGRVGFVGEQFCVQSSQCRSCVAFLSDTSLLHPPVPTLTLTPANRGTWPLSRTRPLAACDAIRHHILCEPAHEGIQTHTHF